MTAFSRARDIVSQFEHAISQIIFPSKCLCCDSLSAEYLCHTCLRHIPVKKQQQCPYCQKKTTLLGQLCPDCFGRTKLDGIYSALPYKDPLVKKLIHTFKYRYIDSIAPILASLVVRHVSTCELSLPDIIMPVPLHARRYRMRGFNQATLIARELSMTLTPGIDIPCLETVLSRTRYTPAQAKTLKRKDRLNNLQDAFSVKTPDAVKNKNIWLVDDVSTTGGTLMACAQPLKKHGAKNVYGIVIAS
jgi:ComF family protein